MDKTPFDIVWDEIKEQVFALVGRNSKEEELLLRFYDHVSEASNCICQLPPQMQQQVAALLVGRLAPNGFCVLPIPVPTK